MSKVYIVLSCAISSLLYFAPIMMTSFDLNATEYNIHGSGYQEPPSELSLACRKGVVEIWFQWKTVIGKSGGYRRHLFDSGDDMDVLLPTLPGGDASGFIKKDKDAKALVAYLMSLSKSDGLFSVQVFPHGADPVNGAWIWRHFNAADFRKAASAIAKECHWDLASPKPSPLKMIPAGAAYPGE